MNVFSKIISLCLLSSTASICTAEVESHKYGYSKPSLPTATKKALQKVLDDAVVDRNLPGIVMIIKKPGYKKWVGSSGNADLSPVVKMNGREAFRIGSITKTFTAALILRLVDEGRLSLDDTVLSLLPDNPLSNYQTQNMTVRMLLSHTSGLNNYVSDCNFQSTFYEDPLSDRFSKNDLLEITNQQQPLFAPGASWAYSNTGYILLGMIAETITGETYSELIQEMMEDDKVKLKRTSAPAFADSSLPKRHAEGHVNWLEYDEITQCLGDNLQNTLVERTDMVPSYSWSAGDMISTGTDLSRWIRKNATGKLLSPELHQQQTAWIPLSPNFSMGLGLMRLSNMFQLNKNIIGHGGNISGYASFAGYIEEDKTTVIQLINRTVKEDMSYPTVKKALHVLYAKNDSKNKN